MLRSRISMASRRALPSRSLTSLRPASNPLRFYSSPSNPRSKPAAALAHTSSSYEPGVMYSSTDKAEAEPHRFNPRGGYPLGQQRTPLHLPSPLPADIVPPSGSMQSELYKSTEAIDAISILSICATRPEFVPRAFIIFTQLLETAKEGLTPVPEAKVWASVVSAMEKLGNGDRATTAAAARTAALWRHRAKNVIAEWEAFPHNDHLGRSEPEPKAGVPALKRQGILIYRAWFAAMLEAESSLEPLLPYLEHPDVGVQKLVDGLTPAKAQDGLAKIEAFANDLGRQDILGQIIDIRRSESDKLAFVERERQTSQVPEVKPVLERQKEQTDKVSSIADASTPILPMARFAIQNLRNNLQQINTPLSAYNRQMALEKASYEAAAEELRESARQLEEAGVENNSRLKRTGLQAQMHKWHQALTEHLESEIKRLRNSSPDAANFENPRWTATSGLNDSTLLVYLTVLPPKKLALITILELMRMVGSGGITDGMKTLRGCVGVGRAVESEHRADTIRDVAGPGSSFWQRSLDPQTLKIDRSQLARVWSEIGRDRDERLKEAEGRPVAEPGMDAREDLRSVWTPPWTQMIQMSLGSFLVDAVIQVAKVTRYGVDHTGAEVSEEQNAFSHGYEYVRGRKLGVIRLNPAVSERLGSDAIRTVIHPKHLPMLVPPRPWAGWNDGAYLSTPVQAMRFKDSIEQVNYLREASRMGHLDAVFHGLDVLSSTPWRINRKVFDTVLTAWNNGDAIADIPASLEKSHYEYPAKPDSSDNDPQRRHRWAELHKAVSAQQRKDHGERCKYNYNLEIARSYLNDVFYIPHNMDFRGRAYPVPPHLSPVGDDLCRGLLTFGVAKPLGSTGLKWLQIHLANVYGFDKASFEERAQFALDHKDDIFDSADNPLGGKRWWLEAEDPWQCLATCFELAAALRSPDPTKFESSLPVHQDGTCNGMQHYAALGGDVRGARAVNLEQGDRPADIYTGVADLVNEMIKADQEKDHNVANLIDLPLGRKVVKQTVMTTVYGVTFVGAREQIAKQLIARGMDREHVYLASTYVAHKVLSSIGDLFSGARAIQDWLTFAARLISRSIPEDRLKEAVQKQVKSTGRPRSRISKELMTSVVWTSPLGLPVVQPYRKEIKKQVMTTLQTVYITDPNLPTQVAPHKQATAFPPNYVHSLDATHMLLTAARCNQQNLTFASVHDSYWTHASTVETMSETIRDTFIHLHSQDLVGELREEFLQRYANHYIPVNDSNYILGEAKKRRKQVAKPKAAEVEVEAEADGAVVDAEALENESESETVREGEEGVNPDELSANIPIHTIHNQRFVRFADILPPTPPRGQFDVQRIRESQYFFS